MTKNQLRESLRELKERAAEMCGLELDGWADSEFFGGSSMAPLDGVGTVSIMREPPEGTPQIQFLDKRGNTIDPATLSGAADRDAFWLDSALVPTEEGGLFQHVHIDDLGIESIDPQVTFEEMENGLAFMFRLHKATPWIIGDFLNTIEAKWGEQMAQVLVMAQRLNMSPSTLEQYKNVTAKVPRAMREPDIPWTMYRLTASQPEVLTEAIAFYREESATVDDAVEHAKVAVVLPKVDADETPAPLQTSPPCPICGQDALGSRACKACGTDLKSLAWYIIDLTGEIKGFIADPKIRSLLRDREFKLLEAIASISERTDENGKYQD